jgi:hypothetical protein
MEREYFVKYEVFRDVMNAVFWNVTSCGSRKNGCFGGKYELRRQCDNNR